MGSFDWIAHIILRRANDDECACIDERMNRNEDDDDDCVDKNEGATQTHNFQW